MTKTSVLIIILIITESLNCINIIIYYNCLKVRNTFKNNLILYAIDYYI